MNIIKQIVLLVCFIGSTLLFGLPEGTESTLGGGSFEISGKNMIIQAPDGSIFEHQKFNISNGETVNFIQPSEQSRVLNRIMDINPSVINGKVSANGQVYIVNPAGIIFGEGSVVEAAKLHVVAGTLSNSDFANGTDNFTSLDGEVKNSGSISANQVIFAGKTVSNAGTIDSTNGEIVMGAGNEMMISSTDGFLSVSLSPEAVIPPGTATDLIGHTILNSGIIRSRETQLHGSAITHDGSIFSEKVKMGNFSQVNADTGGIITSELSLSGSSATEVAENSALAARVNLNSISNQISTLTAHGAFEQINIRSSIDTTILNTSDPLSIQHSDVRVSGGDLNIKLNFSPVFTTQPSSILLATEENLNIETDILNLASNYQFLLFGKNVDDTLLSGFESLPPNVFALDGRSLELNDLKIQLDGDSIQKLSSDNPNTSAFSIGGFEPLTISSTSMIDDSSLDNTDPVTPSEAIPSTTPAFGSYLIPSAIPNYVPSSLSSNVIEETGLLSSAQLDVAIENGLFSNHSYLLTAISTKDSQIKEIANSGGSSSVLGGSYALVEESQAQSIDSAGGQFSKTPSVDDFGDSKSTTEVEIVEASESKEESEEGEDGETANVSEDEISGRDELPVSAASSDLGAVPFAPISTPVLSPAASTILNKALSPRIIGKLNNYIAR